MSAAEALVSMALGVYQVPVLLMKMPGNTLIVKCYCVSSKVT
jgi:hypothetical protein